MSQISLTVPSDDERALVAAGTFFLTLAGKVPALELDDTPEVETTPAITTVDTIKEELPDAFLQLNDAGEWADPTVEPTEEDTEVVGTIANLKDALDKIEKVTVNLDANDLPWDPRIHASSKALNRDSTWRYKRGVDKDVVEAVEAELKGLLSAPAQETTAPPPPPPAQETIAPPPPVEDTAPPPPPQVQEMTIPAFLQLVTANIVAKKWTREEVEQAVKNQGVPGVEKIPHLMAHKELIPKVLEELNA